MEEDDIGDANKKMEFVEGGRDTQRTNPDWLDSVESDREYFINELYDRTSEKILNVIDEIIHDLAGMEPDKVMVDQFIKRLRQQSDSELQHALRSALEYGNGPFEIITRHPLSEVDKKQIEAHIRDVFAMDLCCQFKTSKALGIGIELRTPGWKMGWNVKEYLNDLRQHLFNEFNRLSAEVEVEYKNLSNR